MASSLGLSRSALLALTLAAMLLLAPSTLAAQPSTPGSDDPIQEVGVEAGAICRVDSADTQCQVPLCFDQNAAAVLSENPSVTFADCSQSCGVNEARDVFGGCSSICTWPFVPVAAGGCAEVLDPAHPCVAANRIPSGVDSNLQLAAWRYLPGQDACVTHAEYRQGLEALVEVSAAEDEALRQLDEVAVELELVEEELAQLQLGLDAVRADRLDADAEATQVAWDWELAGLAAQGLQEELDAERVLLQGLAVAAYLEGRDAEAGVMLLAGRPNEVSVSVDYAQSLLDEQQRVVDRIDALEREAAEHSQNMAAVASRSVALAAEAAVDEEALRAAVGRMEETRGRQAELWSQATLAADSLRSAREASASSVGVLQSSSDEIAALLQDVEADEVGESTFDGSLHLPLEGLINSTFGRRVHPYLGVDDFHRGVDIDGRHGEVIRAASAGTVVSAGDLGGYGLAVAINHGGGFSTLYAHQEAVLVAEGQWVDKGEVIGRVGSTGYSTGPHLHFEIRVDGQPVDPVPYLSSLGR